MIIQNHSQYQGMKRACDLSMEILAEMVTMVKPGVYPVEIDQKAADLCKRNGVTSSFFGVPGLRDNYQYSSCIYTNQQAVHGIPSSKRQLQPGDLVKVDFGLIADGYVTDHCVTVGIGQVSTKNLKLLKAGKDAVLAGVDKAVIQKKTGDIGHAIESAARKEHFDTIKHYIGHGIGHTLHESPEVPATGRPKTGTKLEEGMVLCVEAQVVAGNTDIMMENDGWTVSTRDGKNAVMFEYMVIVRKNEPEILTDTRDWPLVVKA